MVKSWMKTASGLKVQQLDIQQQALKLTANRFVFLLLLFICNSPFITLGFKILFHGSLFICSIMFGNAVCMDAWGFPIHDFMQSR